MTVARTFRLLNTRTERARPRAPRGAHLRARFEDATRTHAHARDRGAYRVFAGHRGDRERQITI